jgi:diguanylate cyclase (GGDEF)-like protein
MAKERTELRHRTAAMVDPLTGISNRRAFLQEAATIAERHCSNPKPATVLLFDLDHFKSINDRFGHAVGDRVLEIFTATTGKLLRGSDPFGRLGGEEFAVLMHDVPVEQARTTAERIRQSFALVAHQLDGHEIEATVSIGLAHCDGPALEVGDLLAQADRALYLAKENGRNRVEVASLAAFAARAGEGARALATQNAA